MRIITGTSEESQNLAASLWSSIEDIALGNTNKYTDILEHPTEALYAVQIIESGYYWERIENKLTELGKLNDIETAAGEWKTTN